MKVNRIDYILHNYFKIKFNCESINILLQKSGLQNVNKPRNLYYDLRQYWEKYCLELNDTKDCSAFRTREYQFSFVFSTFPEYPKNIFTVERQTISASKMV